MAILSENQAAFGKPGIEPKWTQGNKDGVGIRLLIADVDGTLVTQDKVLTTRTIEGVNRLRIAGIAFTTTSGRPPFGMKMLIDQLGLTEPLAAFNGGVFVHPDLSVMSQLLGGRRRSQGH